jgi:hypothetical protein
MNNKPILQIYFHLFHLQGVWIIQKLKNAESYQSNDSPKIKDTILLHIISNRKHAMV